MAFKGRLIRYVFYGLSKSIKVSVVSTSTVTNVKIQAFLLAD